MEELKNTVASLEHILSESDIVHISLKMLGSINRDITMHTIRTSYLAWKVAENHPLPKGCSLQNLVLLSLYHTLGFFREDLHFDYKPYSSDKNYFENSKACESKYVFACYYLKYMTPLDEDSVSLEDFLSPYNEDMKHFIFQESYKSIIYLCARISDYIFKNPDKDLPQDINSLAPGQLDPEYVEAFQKANQNNCLLNAIRENTYELELSKFIETIKFSKQGREQLEKLLVYFLDFKSTCTVKHAINTSCYALSLGIRMKLSNDELSELFSSAVLHDIGKIAIPQRILEFHGKLSPEDMGIMKHHVNHSKRILNKHAPDQIIENVYRHHEKLNGKGYPNHINNENLTLIQKILTVADITSALNDSRSYKTEFSTNKTISIIKEMTENGELDPSITYYIENEFDKLLKEQEFLYSILCVDFSNVLGNYNNYLFNDTDLVASAVVSNEDIEEIEDIEDIEDLEEL